MEMETHWEGPMRKLKVGFVWMGEPVSMAVIYVSTTPIHNKYWREIRHTVLDQLPNKHSNLHYCHDIHHPSNPPTEPPLLLQHPRCMALRIPRLGIRIIPLHPLGIHLPVLLEWNGVLVCERVCAVARVVAVVRCIVSTIVTREGDL